MNYTPQSESEIESSSSEIDDEVQCMICGKGIPADEEQEHINAEHADKEEATIPREKEEKTRPQQKKKKAKMYKSARDSESDDNDEINQEVKNWPETSVTTRMQ